MPNRNIEAELRRRRKEWLDYFARQGGNTVSRLAPQELFRSSPHLLRGYIVWGGVCEKDQGSMTLVFFLLQSFKMVRLLTRTGCVQGLR